MKKIFLILLISAGLAFAQQINLENKFRMGQNFESAGDMESAVKIYEEIYSKDSLNPVYFDALIRVYDQLKRYDDAKRIIREKLKRQPKDISLLSKLGTICARAGDAKEAEDIWEGIIKDNSNNINVYYIVANAMIESRMFESALKIYERGRKVSKSEFMFVPELGYLHSILMNYTEATREYLLLLKQSAEQLNFVQSRIAMYTSKTDGLKAAIFVTETELQKDVKNIPLNRLIAWLYMEGKDYEKAFNIYKVLDELVKAGGQELFNFAEKAKRERAFSTAAKAYQEILSKFSKHQNMSAIKYGYAETLEAALQADDTLKIFGELFFPVQNNSLKDSIIKKYDEVINLYNQITEQYPNTEYAIRALYRKAFIYYTKYFDIEKSLQALDEIEKSYKFNSNLYIESVLLKAKLLIVNNELEEAKTKLQWLKNFAVSTPEQKDYASFMIAEINYLQGNFKDALSLLQEVLKNQTGDIVNDAINLNVFIQDNLEDEPSLKSFAQSQLLRKQRNYLKAIDLLNKLENIKSELAVNAISELGDVFVETGNYEEALKKYQKLLKDFPDNLLADKTLLKIAEIYHYVIKDKVKAEEYYKMLLEKYPLSIYVNVARQKIRNIRGDVL